MGFDVYDYRTHIQNLLATPQIRSRFLKIEPGEISGGPRQGEGHSHDLGHEVFLVLQGQAEFEIDGERRVLEPGQMCVALVDQIHTVRNAGNEPVILYLSVTPHIQPTHTFWSTEGTKLPPRFNPASAYDAPPDRSTDFTELVGRQAAAAEALLAAVQQASEVQRAQLDVLKQKAIDGNKAEALAARDTIWQALYPMFQQMYALADAWNTLTYATAESDFLAEHSGKEQKQDEAG